MSNINTKLIFSIILLISAGTTIKAQNNKEHWEAYMASYEKGAGSTLVNFSLRNLAPIKEYPFIVITGVTFSDCSPEGLPTRAEFAKLYIVSDSVQACVKRRAKAINAGTFTYQCQRLDYIYVKDTAQIRQMLQNLYAKHFKQYVPYINIKKDSSWEAYNTFLFPNEETQEDMSNTKVLLQLQKAGDKLDKARLIDHWLYFATQKDRENFIVYAKGKLFEIVEKTSTKGPLFFGLHISRVDKVALADINSITLELRRTAKKFNGDYDGWECIVVK